jgi:hypothetical protein
MKKSDSRTTHRRMVPGESGLISMELGIYT